MAKPVKKSPPIQFRVPIEQWPTLEERAKAKNMSVNDFVADTITASLRRAS